jgi:hypothetical protein
MANDKPGVTISLTKPIHAYGEDLSELTFREPSGGDIAAAGMPVRFDLSKAEPDIEFNATEMTAMLSRLASVPPSSIALLTAGDWISAAYAVAPFFVPGAATR